MKTLLLEIDDAIYPQVIDFLKLLPKNQCHVVEPRPMDSSEHLDVSAAFGLIKTPITATLAEIEQGIIAGAVNDRY